jgi:putative addiction module antidote
MYQLKINQVNDGVGITLPKEVLQKLKVKEGDTILVKETAEGFEMKVDNSDFEKAMKAYEKINQRYENALRELAK